MNCGINYGEYTLVFGKSGEYWVENEEGFTTLLDADEESADPYYSTAVSQW